MEGEIAPELPLLGSRAGLVFAHIMITIPWTVRLLTASLAGFDRSVEEAALNLGATPLQAFFKVTLPVIKPGMVAAALFGFIISFGNLEMTLFLVAPGQTTLPIAILQYLQWRIDPTIAAVSLLLGPSGCGKTTTLRMIAGFIAPTAGEIRLGGHDITRQPPWKRNTGLVFQSYALFPHLTVADNVAFGLRMRKIAPPEVAVKSAEGL